jgi:predicted permease
MGGVAQTCFLGLRFFATIGNNKPKAADLESRSALPVSMSLRRELSKFGPLFRRSKPSDDLEEEIRAHLEMEEQENLESGMAPEEAHYAALRRFGNVALAQERSREMWGWNWVETLWRDIRFGMRQLRRDPGVSGLIVLVLALGIGGNAAVFTLLKAAFFDPLPFRDAGRLVTVIESDGWIPTVSEFLEIRAHTRTLESMAFAEDRDMQLSGTGEPTRVFAARVTASFFPLLRVNAAQGRTFVQEENQPGQAPVVILSDAFWRSRLGADPGVVGRTLRLDGQPAVVVGVLPPTFHFDYPTLGAPEPVDLYVPYPIESSLPFERAANGQGVAVRVIGRLRDGVTLAQVEADLWDIALVLARENTSPFPGHPHDPAMFAFNVMPLREAIVGNQRSLLWLLLGGVGVLLLIACANTAQLLLARSLRRAREIAIRAALGASRLRLIRQFLLEGQVLACCGGVAGLLVAGWIACLLVRLLPVRSPLLAAAHVDARVVGFTTTVSIFSAIVFAIIPAVKGSRWTPGPSLSARVATGEGNRWRHAMIAIEAALSVFLLCGAGLVAQNLWNLISAPLGFNPEHVLAMRLKLPFGKVEQPDPRAGKVLEGYVEKIEAIPGVEAAATVSGPPLRPARGGGPVRLLGSTDPGTFSWSHQISPDYFRTLGIPLLAGRTFRLSDAGPKLTVAIVNEEFARHFGLGPNVIGKLIDYSDPPVTIVGMVGTVRASPLETKPDPECYISSLESSWPNVYLLVRSPLPPGQLLKEVKAAIASVNPGQALFGVQTMNELVADSVPEPRFHVYLIGAFALLAVAMASAGMYSVIAFLVSQRTSEIAIRMALGAGRGAIIKTVLATTSLWVVAGLAGGLYLGLAASTTLRSLTDTEATGSPAMYAVVALFFLAVTVVAAYLPARRATRLDPAVALRCE